MYSLIDPGTTTTVSDRVTFISAPTFTQAQGATWCRDGADTTLEHTAETANQDVRTTTAGITLPVWSGSLLQSSADVIVGINGIDITPLRSISGRREGLDETIALYKITPPLIGTFSISMSVAPRSGTIHYPAINP